MKQRAPSSSTVGSFIAGNAARSSTGSSAGSTAGNARTGAYGTRIEHQTGREAALKLVDLVGYRTAEAMYERDAYQIACRLDVTLQVVKDCRTILV